MAISPQVIQAFFLLKDGTPALGLTPSIIITNVTLTAGSPQGDTIVIGSGSPEVFLTEVGNGFYKFVFSTYDNELKYSFRIDGEARSGTNLGNGRFAVGTNQSFADDIAFRTWEEPTGDHQTGSPQSFGQLMTDILTFTETLLKFQANRTVLDKVAFTLTIFDNDDVTPIRVFDLRQFGVGPSITEITERLPASGSPFTP